MIYKNITEVCNIQIGKTPKRSEGKYWGKGNSWISIADMNSKFIGNSKEEVSDLAIKENNMKIVPGNTVIMSFKLSIGKVAITTKELYTNEAIAAFTIKNHNLLLAEYLYYILKSYNYDHLMDNAARGKTLNKRKLEQIEIPLISIKDQEQIIKVLNKAEDLLRYRKQQIEALSSLKQSVFFDMFGDSITNPNNYPVNILDEIATVRSSKRVFVKELTDDGIPFYRGNEIGLLAEDKELESILYISKDHYEELKKSSGIPAIGDLLLPSICSDGRIYRVNHNEPFYFKDGRVLWIKFFDEKDVNSTYIQYALKDKFLRDYSNIASGTTFAELKIFSLKKVEIMVPPINLQNKFENIVTQIENQRTTLKNSLNKMNLLYDSILHKAFNGELFKEGINV